MIRATEAELARIDQKGVELGPSISTKLMAASLRQRLSELQQRFTAASEIEELDVCSYRMISDRNGRYPVFALTSALAGFQKFVSVLYEAISTGMPRNSTKLSAKTREATTLDVAYSFSGSLGFVLTMPRDSNERQDAILESAVSAMFELAKANNSQAVAEFAKKFGTAPVQIAHTWAKAHVDAGISVDIEWKRGKIPGYRALAQVVELERLTRIIEDAEDSVSQQVEYYGRLIAGNISSRTFILDTENGRISGKLHPDIPLNTEMSLGRNYRAVVLQETRRLFAANREVVTNYLIALSPLPDAPVA